MTRRRAAKSPRTHVGLEQRFLASLRALELRPGQQIVVGFSGGRDSLALAQLFARTKRVTGVEPRLFHVNHNLRSASGHEAEQAATLAKQIGLPITVAELEPGLVIRHPGLGVEEAARRERYLALKDFARKRRIEVVAIAHQRQDQAETVLLHLLRGAGISGMAAMSEISDVRIPWWVGPTRTKPIRLWRPLLDEDPEGLNHYLRTHELEPIEDPSNAESDFLRNRIRSEILPALESIQPQATEAIARFAKIAALEDEFLSSVTDAAAMAIVFDHMRIDRLEAQHAHPVFLRRLFKRQIESAGVTDVRFDRVDEAAKLVNEEPSDKMIQLGDGVIAVSDPAWIYIGREEDVTDQLQIVHDVWLVPKDWPKDHCVEIALDKPVTVEGKKIHASADTAKFGKRSPSRPFLPAEAFADHLVLRKVREGDLWANQGISVREHLRNQRIPPIIRSKVMVFASTRGVWYIPGVSRPREAIVNPTKPIVYLDMEAIKSGEDS